VLTAGSISVTTGAIVSWVAFSLAFGLGIPAGSAMVALGHSRRTFTIRAVDAGIGIAAAAVFAVVGWVSAVPAGLAVGAFVGAALLVQALGDDTRAHPPIEHEQDVDHTAAPEEESPAVFEPAHWRWTTSEPISNDSPIPPPPMRPVAGAPPARAARSSPPPPRRAAAVDWRRELLWVVPLSLIVATEFKTRRRSIDDALSGSIDLMIAIELVVYAVVGVWAMWRLVPSRPRLEPLTIIMWGYVLSTAVSALYSQYPTLAFARAVQLVIIATVIQLLANEGGLQSFSRLLHGWVVLLTVSIIAGLLYVAPTTGPQEGRFTWLSVHSVSAGSMLALSVPVLFGLWIAAGRRALPWPRWVYGSLFAVHLVFLLLTRTRGSIGGALVAIAVMAWLSSGRKLKPELVLGSLVVAGALALAVGRQVLEFLTRGESVDQIGTFNRRTEIWSLAWDSFLEHPVFGLGFNSAKGVFFDETGLGGAHNAAINVMIDVGLVGLAWWLALIIGAIVVLRRLQAVERRSPVLLLGASGTARSDHLILIGVFTAMLVNSITTEGLGAGVNVSAIWLFVVCAWLTILDRDQRAVRSARQGELAGEVRDGQLEALT
jgi:O-antigen ligase